jgi:hypothetical protein
MVVVPGSTVMNTGPRDYPFFEFGVLGTGTTFRHSTSRICSVQRSMTSLGKGRVTPPIDPDAPEPGSESAVLSLFGLRRSTPRGTAVPVQAMPPPPCERRCESYTVSGAPVQARTHLVGMRFRFGIFGRGQML